MNSSARRNSVEFEISPFDNGDICDDIIPTHADDIQNKTEENILRILWILLMITYIINMSKSSDSSIFIFLFWFYFLFSEGGMGTMIF
jgi:hypothetical protein